MNLRQRIFFNLCSEFYLSVPITLQPNKKMRVTEFVYELYAFKDKIEGVLNSSFVAMVTY